MRSTKQLSAHAQGWIDSLGLDKSQRERLLKRAERQAAFNGNQYITKSDARQAAYALALIGKLKG